MTVESRFEDNHEVVSTPQTNQIQEVSSIPQNRPDYGLFLAQL